MILGGIFKFLQVPVRESLGLSSIVRGSSILKEGHAPDNGIPILFQKNHA